MPAEPSRQNWNSGISWIARECTFFRNFATFAAAIYALDVWPMAFELEKTDYIENQAGGLLYSVECFSWLMYVGTERRSGFSSLVRKATHYDGGYSEGIVGILPVTLLSFDPNDDPEAVLNATSSGVNFLNFGDAWWGILDTQGIFPPPSDQQRQVNVRLIDYEMVGNLALSTGDTFDSGTTFNSATHTLVERARYEGNG